MTGEPVGLCAALELAKEYRMTRLPLSTIPTALALPALVAGSLVVLRRMRAVSLMVDLAGVEDAEEATMDDERAFAIADGSQAADR